MTAPEQALRLAIQSVLALAHLLPPLFLLFRRRESKPATALLILYCALSAAWGLTIALAAYGSGWAAAQAITRLADCASRDVPVLLVALLVPIAYLNFDRRWHWAWGAAGATWFVVTFGLQACLGLGAARTWSGIAIVGWLTFSCLVVALSALWTLRAGLTFYRNRGIYWLGLLVLLLAGQGLVLVQYRWSEIGLMLHLLGTTGIVLCTTTGYLPNIKNLLRSAVGYSVLAVATALLYLLGLLTMQPLLLTNAGLGAILAGAVIVAIALALVHHPFHRFVTRILNQLLWGEEHDPAQMVREYGRTISNVIDMEQLARLAIGTINKALHIERGALMVAYTAEGHVTFQVIAGLGEASREQVTLTVHSPILSHLALRGEPMFQYDLEHHPDLREVLPKEKKQLHTLGMEIYLPILTQERLLGLLALGPQRTGEPYGPREVALLTTLAQQTAAALENARLFDRLRTLNAEITQLNEDLQMAYKRLQKLDRAKTDFLSISSHELRTPLTVLQGYTGIFEELVADEALTLQQARDIVRKLKEGVDRLAIIVTAMLDASAVETEGLDLNLTSTTLQGITAMTIQPWREAISERQLNLTVEGVDDIPPMEADVQWLCQALGNILSNAIKYTPDGGRISIHASPAGDEHVEIVIADTGVGIDPEDQELIFEKFYRVGDILLHSTGDTKFKGAGPGLGLHIARGVIEGHGGRIWVESAGHDEARCPGSAFHVLLPLRAKPPTKGRTR